MPVRMAHESHLPMHAHHLHCKHVQFNPTVMKSTMTDPAATTLSTQLQRVFEVEPGLKQALHPGQDIAEITGTLADAAQRHGLPLDTQALRQWLDVMRQIGQLVESDRALRQGLEAAQSATQAAELIQRAARRQGLALEAPAPRPGAGVRELADAELEPAVGGLMLTVASIVVGSVVVTAAGGLVLSAAAFAAGWIINDHVNRRR